MCRFVKIYPDFCELFLTLPLKNPEAMAKLHEGLEDIKKGRISSLGSFAKYAKEKK